MEKPYENVFGLAASPDLTERLSKKVIQRIRMHEMALVRFRMYLSGIIFLGAFGALIPILKILIQSFQESELLTYASLLVSDGFLVLEYWKSLLFSIAGSFPMTSAVAALLLLAICLACMRQIFKYMDEFKACSGFRLKRIPTK